MILAVRPQIIGVTIGSNLRWGLPFPYDWVGPITATTVGSPGLIHVTLVFLFEPKQLVLYRGVGIPEHRQEPLESVNLGLRLSRAGQLMDHYGSDLRSLSPNGIAIRIRPLGDDIRENFIL